MFLQLNNAKAPWLHSETQLAWDRTLYENIPSIYLTVDAKGKILSVNSFGAKRSLT
jgi:hypothetical protein